MIGVHKYLHTNEIITFFLSRPTVATINKGPTRQSTLSLEINVVERTLKTQLLVIWIGDGLSVVNERSIEEEGIITAIDFKMLQSMRTFLCLCIYVHYIYIKCLLNEVPGFSALLNCFFFFPTATSRNALCWTKYVGCNRINGTVSEFV